MRSLFDGRCRLCAVALAGALACAPDARAQSLADTLVTAYRNSPELGAARANVKAQAERAVQARAEGRPVVQGDLSISGDVEEEFSSGDFFNGGDFDGGDSGGGFDSGGTSHELNFPSTVSLSVTQPLYTGGQIANSTEAAETRTSEQEVLLTATEQQLLLDAATAFLDVRRDEELVEVARNNVGVLSEQLRAAQERFEVGEVTRTDVEQARSRLAAARSRLAANKGALEASRQTYRQVVGEPPAELAPPPPLPDLPDGLDSAVAIAVQEDPRIRAARLEREATGSDVRTAIGALLPQVSLQASASSFDDDFGGEGRTQSASVGLSVTIPFWTGGRNYARVREAQAIAERASADITAEMRATVERTGIAWANLEVARASIEAGEIEVRAAELAFEGITEEAKVGARTTLDVLDTEQDVLDARADLVEARRDEHVAAYTLLAAIGKLTVEHLGLEVGERPQVASYYQAVRDRHFGYDETDDTVWRHDLRP